MQSRVHKYWSFLLASVAAAALALVSLLQWLGEGLPENGPGWWLSICALVLVSLAIGASVNALGFRALARLSNEKKLAEERYAHLRKSLVPILTKGLEQLIENRSSSLSAVGGSEPLRIYSFVKIEGSFRVLASTVDKASPVRRMRLSHDEGVIGFTIDRQAPVITRSLKALENPGLVLDLAGQEIGFQPLLRQENLEKCDSRQKWILSIPVFGESRANPWEDQILGVLTLDCCDESGKSAFLDEQVQHASFRLAADVATYLVALRALWPDDEVPD